MVNILLSDPISFEFYLLGFAQAILHEIYSLLVIQGSYFFRRQVENLFDLVERQQSFKWEIVALVWLWVAVFEQEFVFVIVLVAKVEFYLTNYPVSWVSLRTASWILFLFSSTLVFSFILLLRSGSNFSDRIENLKQDRRFCRLVFHSDVCFN